VLLGELMAQKAIARTLGAIALEISTARIAIALPHDTPLDPVIAGWRRLPDGRYATAPPAKPALTALAGLSASSSAARSPS
jgi:hypothetical protein